VILNVKNIHFAYLAECGIYINNNDQPRVVNHSREWSKAMTHLASNATGGTFRGLRLHFPLDQWIRVARERRRLAGLSERQLRDIGIDDTTAAREVARPFWDVPKGR
jgi:uncharacterized protein YjiS (DUF1127 family)